MTIPQPLLDMDLRAVVEVSCGGYHSIGRTLSGHVYSWGWGDNGQLGRGDLGMASDNDHIPSLVPGIRGATKISAGQLFSLAVTRDGNIYCWGAGGSGQLGLGTTVSSNVPEAAVGPSSTNQSMRELFAVDACAGQAHVLARIRPLPPPEDGRESGSRSSRISDRGFVAYAWGRNNHGQAAAGGSSCLQRGAGGWADCLKPEPVRGKNEARSP